MTNRSNRNQRKSKSTPPYNPVKKGRNQTFSPPIISQNIPDIAPMSQRDSPLSPLVAEESLSGDSFRSSTTEDDDSSQQSSTTDHQPIPKRLPPIFLTIKPEYPWRTMAKSLYESPEHEYVSTTSKINEIKLNCPDEVAFRSVQSFLASIQDKVGFHTHALPSQRTLKIVIKGIPLNITDQEITDELKSNGFEPAFIRTFSKNGHRIPLHMVTLANLELAKDIYQISKLFFINVKIEPYRSSGPAQCYKRRPLLPPMRSLFKMRHMWRHPCFKLVHKTSRRRAQMLQLQWRSHRKLSRMPLLHKPQETKRSPVQQSSKSW